MQLLPPANACFQVNHSPSLTTDTPLDLELKSRLVREVRSPAVKRYKKK